MLPIRQWFAASKLLSAPQWKFCSIPLVQEWSPTNRPCASFWRDLRQMQSGEFVEGEYFKKNEDSADLTEEDITVAKALQARKVLNLMILRMKETADTTQLKSLSANPQFKSRTQFHKNSQRKGNRVVVLKKRQQLKLLNDLRERNQKEFKDKLNCLETISAANFQLPAAKLQLTSLDKAYDEYRNKWTLLHLIHKIEDTARRLVDRNVDPKCQRFYYIDSYDKNTELYKKNPELEYTKCWISLLRFSQTPIADSLRNELKNENIPEGAFSFSIKELYFTLLARYGSPEYEMRRHTEYIHIGRKDIYRVLNSLGITWTDRDSKCIQILYNLDERQKITFKGQSFDWLPITRRRLILPCLPTPLNFLLVRSIESASQRNLL